MAPGATLTSASTPLNRTILSCVPYASAAGLHPSCHSGHTSSTHPLLASFTGPPADSPHTTFWHPNLCVRVRFRGIPKRHQPSQPPARLPRVQVPCHQGALLEYESAQNLSVAPQWPLASSSPCKAPTESCHLAGPTSPAPSRAPRDTRASSRKEPLPCGSLFLSSVSSFET